MDTLQTIGIGLGLGLGVYAIFLTNIRNRRLLASKPVNDQHHIDYIFEHILDKNIWEVFDVLDKSVFDSPNGNLYFINRFSGDVMGYGDFITGAGDKGLIISHNIWKYFGKYSGNATPTIFIESKLMDEFLRIDKQRMDAKKKQFEDAYENRNNIN